MEWVVDPDRARLESGGSDGSEAVPFDGVSEVSLAVTVVQPGGASLTYRQALTAEPTGTGVRVVWPPETRVCRLTVDCGSSGTYPPDHPEEHVEGVRIDATVDAAGNATRVDRG